MNTRDQIRHTSDLLYAAWNAHDAAAIAILYADDAEIVDVTGGTTMTGRALIYAGAVDRLAGFPDLALHRHRSLIDGRTCAERWVMTGTQTGVYQGLPASGHAVEVAGATFSEMNVDGLIARDTHYIDVPTLLRQLGID